MDNELKQIVLRMVPINYKVEVSHDKFGITFPFWCDSHEQKICISAFHPDTSDEEFYLGAIVHESTHARLHNRNIHHIDKSSRRFHETLAFRRMLHFGYKHRRLKLIKQTMSCVNSMKYFPEYYEGVYERLTTSRIWKKCKELVNG